MKIDISESELGLCIGALELGVKELREGQEASERLKMSLPTGFTEIADRMDSLRTKLLAHGQSGKDHANRS